MPYHRGFICVSLWANTSPRQIPMANCLSRVSASLLDLEPRQGMWKQSVSTAQTAGNGWEPSPVRQWVRVVYKAAAYLGLSLHTHALDLSAGTWNLDERLCRTPKPAGKQSPVNLQPPVFIGYLWIRKRRQNQVLISQGQVGSSWVSLWWLLRPNFLGIEGKSALHHQVRGLKAHSTSSSHLRGASPLNAASSQLWHQPAALPPRKTIPGHQLHLGLDRMPCMPQAPRNQHWKWLWGEMRVKSNPLTANEQTGKGWALFFGFLLRGSTR